MGNPIFFSFRFFDILKPFPINLVDNNIKNVLVLCLMMLLQGYFLQLFFTYCSCGFKN